jgi:hypothetical protein
VESTNQRNLTLLAIAFTVENIATEKICSSELVVFLQKCPSWQGIHMDEIEGVELSYGLSFKKIFWRL